ncbi:hypothetical protein OROMI_006436 [Orobanche minor]
MKWKQDVESEDRNHVEIGVNSSIGRGSLRDAAAGDDSKIDYLVQFSQHRWLWLGDILII